MSAASAQHVLHRETFQTSRLLDFCSERELVKQIGHPIEQWPVVILKELTDNALVSPTFLRYWNVFRSAPKKYIYLKTWGCGLHSIRPTRQGSEALGQCEYFGQFNQALDVPNAGVGIGLPGFLKVLPFDKVTREIAGGGVKV